MNFLFRKPSSHIFLTTEDPTYRYEWTCGHCDYPVTRDDEVCPRCQRWLEECPVCSLRNHKHPARRRPEQADHRCTVCGVDRLPFNDERVIEIEGTYCTNIYGCPAGGLLLKTEQFAVLPRDASCCPICRHEALKPRDLIHFLYQLNRCLFCNTCFGPESSWAAGWADTLGTIDRIGVVCDALPEPCVLCGREDVYDAEKDQVVTASVSNHGERRRETLSRARYLRLAELGRILVLEEDDRTAFRKCFGVWFEHGCPPNKEAGIPVSEIAGDLLKGTLRKEIRTVLQGRLASILSGWDRSVGPSYDVPSSEPSSISAN